MLYETTVQFRSIVMATFKWLRLEFEVLDYRVTWHDKPGIYIFARPISTGWSAQYVGQTDSFRDRIPNHPRWQGAVRRGATHVHARVVTQSTKRDTLERDLIAALEPPMNVYLR